MSTSPEKHPFDLKVFQLRLEVRELASKLEDFMRSPKPGGWLADFHDPEEARANLMLAYRHLEDARMRLGKAVQARDGGTSVYDR